jgi:peptidoglycan/LPS O-acetylase OafA/YrhL
MSMPSTCLDRGPATDPPAVSVATPPRFALIDAIRGVAAVAIAAYHIHRYGPLPEVADQLLSPAVQWVVDHGWIGVQFFFVIAGFVTAYTLRTERVSPTLIGTFALRRVLRLGIPYWVVVGLVASLNWVAVHTWHDDSLAGEVTPARFLAQLVFVQNIVGFDSLSAGMWFVPVDLQFGLLFVVLLGCAQGLSGGRGQDGFRAAWALLVVMIPPALAALFVFNLDSNWETWICYFFHMPALGAMAWWALEGRIPRSAFWLYAAALVIGLAVRWRLEVAIALVAGLTLYLAGRIGRLDCLRFRSLQYLGRISYSLFLIHYPVSWLVEAIGYRWTGTNPVAAVLWLMAALGASLVAAQGLYVLVEMPANRLARRWKSSG